MYRFQIQVQPRTAATKEGPPLQLADRTWPTLNFVPSAARRGFASFDAALTALEQLPRMFAEPDGSFVWVGETPDRWQVDGNLFDRGDELAYVSLSGACPAAEFDQLLRCFGWPEIELVFELTREGVYVDEATFREFALRLPE